MRITAGDVLEQVQNLLGEPAGAYYDMRFRLRLLGQAQVEMVEDAVGSAREIELDAQDGDIFLPDDFLSFNKQAPYFREHNGTVSKLKVVDPSYMDTYVREWQADAPTVPVGVGTPRFLISDGTQHLRVWPKPSSGYVVIPYTPSPDKIWSEDDLIFGGDPTLARYSTALAYKIAAHELMARVPQQAQLYESMYERELRSMRHNRRTNPQVRQQMRTKGFFRGRNGY